jgi:hypothetical protein
MRSREGFDVVYTVREEREGERRFKRATAAWFYRGFNRISTVHVPVGASPAACRRSSRYPTGSATSSTRSHSGTRTRRSARSSSLRALELIILARER